MSRNLQNGRVLYRIHFFVLKICLNSFLKIVEKYDNYFELLISYARILQKKKL